MSIGEGRGTSVTNLVGGGGGGAGRGGGDHPISSGTS